MEGALNIVEFNCCGRWERNWIFVRLGVRRVSCDYIILLIYSLEWESFEPKL